MDDDVDIMDDEADPVDFGPNQLAGEGVMHGGYAFHENYFVVHNDLQEGPVVMPVHEVVMEDYILGSVVHAYQFAGGEYYYSSVCRYLTCYIYNI